jgi:hypothetical protein
LRRGACPYVVAHLCQPVAYPGGELRCRAYLLDIKDILAVLGVLEVVQVIHVPFD